MKRVLATCICLLFFSGIAAAEPTKAVAKMFELKDGKPMGEVRFEEQAGGGMKIVTTLFNLPANSEHGFHIHEFGDCTVVDGSGAGPHFNPSGMKHGGPQSPERHAGDLGNVKSDVKGSASMTAIDTGSISAIVGRSVILHEKADDMKTDPAGNAGLRVACGVIGIAK